jgi:hypothetical protein
MRPVENLAQLVCSGCLIALSATAHLHAEEAVRTIKFRSPAQAQTSDERSTLVAIDRPAPPTPPLEQPAVVLASFEESAPQPILPAQPAAEPAPLPIALPAPSAPPRSFPRLGTTSPVIGQPLLDPRVTNQTRQALSFYGGHSARATLSQLPRRASIQPSRPQSVRRHAKPFQSIHHDPTVSPYLNLYRDEENTESAPTYFAFVRPQMEQLDANRTQQREIQQLRGQLQTMSSTVAGPSYQATGTPGTGTQARYMDTAQFYGSWSR